MPPKSVADVEGPWRNPNFESGLIIRLRNAWHKPVNKLSKEQLATFLRQRVALLLIIREARRRLEDGFEEGSEMYEASWPMRFMTRKVAYNSKRLRMQRSLSMIRAIYHNGKIQPLDGIPAEWQDGDELVIEAVPSERSTESFDDWAADLRAATAGITDEDHAQFMAALADVERESKELGRREMERAAHLFDDDSGSKFNKEAG
jgi:hypothetical protein